MKRPEMLNVVPEVGCAATWDVAGFGGRQSGFAGCEAGERFVQTIKPQLITSLLS